jgi:hypothetical protein
MATCLVFIMVWLTGKVFEPMALVVGGMICVAAANAGATSQILKQVISLELLRSINNWRYLLGHCFFNCYWWTVKILDTHLQLFAALGVKHAIGETYSAPQATLMATIIKGILEVISIGSLLW